MQWKIVDSGMLEAAEIMRLDAEWLERVDELTGPLLHLYEWAGESATYGYFIHPEELLNSEAAKTLQLHLARRPTGGGIVFHLWDLAFSVLVPAHAPEFSTNTLDNYAFVNNAVLGAVKEFLADAPPLLLTPEDNPSWDPNCAQFCMARPTKYDVMWEGRKIAGAAQRKTRKGYLHQGTIALVAPSLEYLDQVLLPGTLVKEAMLAHTAPLLRGAVSEEELRAARRDLRALLATHLTHASLSLLP